MSDIDLIKTMKQAGFQRETIATYKSLCLEWELHYSEAHYKHIVYSHRPFSQRCTNVQQGQGWLSKRAAHYTQTVILCT